MQLRKAAYLGFKFQLYLKVLNVVLHQVGTILVAILLAPSDFALVGIALVFVGFFASMADFGIGSALIQRPEASNDLVAAGATLRLILSLILVGILVLLAPIVAVAYGEPNLRTVIWVLSLLVILNFLGFVARVTLTKNLRFREVFIPEITAGVATTLSTIALALMGFSYWSLVFGSLTGALVGSSMLYAISPWQAKWTLDRKLSRDLIAFGLPLVAGNVLFFTFQNLGVGVLGLIDFAHVGYYLLALSWAVSIPLGLHTTIDNVMFPIYSAMRSDLNRMKTAYVDSLKYLGRVAVPLGAFFSVGASYLVLALVGYKWAPAIIPLRILGIAGTLLVFSLTYHSIAVSLGRPREVLAYNLLGVVVMTPLSIIGAVLCGAVGLAIATLIASGILFVWALFRIHFLLGDLGPAYREVLLKPGLASLSFVFAIELLGFIVPVTLEWFVVVVILAGVTYLITMQLMTRGRFLRETKQLASGLLRA